MQLESTTNCSIVGWTYTGNKKIATTIDEVANAVMSTLRIGLDEVYPFF